MQIQSVIENVIFQRVYAIICIGILSLNILLLILGVFRNPLIQDITSVFILLGLILCVGEVFIIINMIDKSNLLGGILHRLAYADLIAILLAYILITITTYLSSFYIFGEASVQVNSQITSISIAVYSILGICISYIAFRSSRDGATWKYIASSI